MTNEEKNILLKAMENGEIDELLEFIKYNGNIEFVQKCLHKGYFKGSQQKEIIISWHNIDFTRMCLENNDLDLKSEDKEDIVISMHDVDFLIECLENKRIDEMYIPWKIGETGNLYFIKECLNNKKINLEDWKNKIIVSSKQNEFIEEKFGDVRSIALNLPENMTIGMEIESEGKNSFFIKEYLDYKKWEAKGDGSLRDGVEIVSPILQSTEQATKEIYTVTGMLNGLEQSVSERCGGHIHIGADYLTSVQSYKNLMELWCNNERALYAMSNEKGTQPRDGITHFAPPLSSKMHDAMENGTINLEDEEDLGEFVSGLKEVQGDRDSGINFLNVNTSKNTVEFRLANGTLDPELWIENANLFGGMVAIAEELAQIQKNGVRTEEEKHKLEIFEQLKSDISEKEKVEILLELAGVEPETYMQRYEANIELIKENQEMEEVFAGKEPLDFKAAKEKFKGKESQEIQASARAQIEARDNILEGHERNLQNERDNRNGISFV